MTDTTSVLHVTPAADKGVRPMALQPKRERRLLARLVLADVTEIFRHGDLDTGALLSSLLLIGALGILYPAQAVLGGSWEPLVPYNRYVPPCIMGVLFLLVGVFQLWGMVAYKHGGTRRFRSWGALVAGLAWLFLAYAEGFTGDMIVFSFLFVLGTYHLWGWWRFYSGGG